MSSRKIRLILNGKKAGLPSVRDAVGHVRGRGHTVDVSVTWEGGDAGRFAAEALADGTDVIVAAGGDGTVNEVVNGIMDVTDAPQAAMGVVPLGSANDFATGCGIAAGDPKTALELAASAEPVLIDVARVNERHFLNALVAGFGAEVTFRTSERLKRTIGGAAYAITGMLTAMKQRPYKATLTWSGGSRNGDFVFAAAANGRQAGGFAISRTGKLDDGHLDTIGVLDFSPARVKALVGAIMNPGREQSDLIRYNQLDWFEVEADREIPASPDGEMMHAKHFRFDVLTRRLPFVLPPGLDLVGS
jgi:lipid kinase YegS